MNKIKPIPKFKNEDEEFEFWSTHDFTDYFDFKNNRVDISEFRVKPSTKPVTLRLTQSLLEDLKREADKRDVPYQSLMKVWLADRVADERGKYTFKKKS